VAVLSVLYREIMEIEFVLHRLKLVRRRIIERHPDEAIVVGDVRMNFAHRYVGEPAAVLIATQLTIIESLAL
jgi:hypothetical protein